MAGGAIQSCCFPFFALSERMEVVLYGREAERQ